MAGSDGAPQMVKGMVAFGSSLTGCTVTPSSSRTARASHGWHRLSLVSW